MKFCSLMAENGVPVGLCVYMSEGVDQVCDDFPYLINMDTELTWWAHNTVTCQHQCYHINIETRSF